MDEVVDVVVEAPVDPVVAKPAIATAEVECLEGEIVAVPVVAGTTPTPAEAEQMFADRPDLAAVLTTEGRMTRDGMIG